MAFCLQGAALIVKNKRASVTPFFFLLSYFPVGGWRGAAREVESQNTCHPIMFQEKAQKEHTVSKTDKYKTHQASYRNVYSQLRGRTD